MNSYLPSGTLECEIRLLPYLFKLRHTARVKELVIRMMHQGALWQDCGDGWQALETTLRLSGWTRARRVILVRESPTRAPIREAGKPRRGKDRQSHLANAQGPGWEPQASPLSGKISVIVSSLEAIADLDDLTRYVSLPGVGARRDLSDAQALQVEQSFATARCTACQTPTLTKSPHHPMSELRNQTIRPYTDLFLHDLGPGLADTMGESAANGSEWRPTPLCNIGLSAGVSDGEAYLHDSRARRLEEAILWHGGEAEASKQAFLGMSAADRAALICFLKSL